LLRRSGIISALALSVVAGAHCSSIAKRKERELARERAVLEWRKPLSPKEATLLEEAVRHPCEEPKRLNYRELQQGDADAAAALAWNNNLWITLYETARRRSGSFGARFTEGTDEGAVVTVYYLVKDGVVRRITDWSRDRFAGAGVTEETLARIPGQVVRALREPLGFPLEHY
jgi:hypothetical protein